MVGRRESRTNFLIEERAERALHSQSNLPAPSATTESRSRGRNSYRASLSRNAKNDISEPMHRWVALRDAARFAQRASVGKRSPCFLPEQTRLRHCKKTNRPSPRLVKTALNVS